MFRRIGLGLGIAASYLPVILRDTVGLAAAASIAYGAWMLHPAAGFITGGILVLAGVALLSVSAGRSKN